MPERTTLTAKIEASKDAPALEQLDLEYQSRILTTKIDEAKHHASEIRTSLRKMHFSAVEDNTKGIVFYPKESQMPDAKIDDRVYRIRIGNKALQTESLKLSGGGAVVGDVPKGLPKIGIPSINASGFPAVTTLCHYHLLARFHGSHRHRQGHGSQNRTET